MNNILLYFSIKYKGDWDLIYKAIENKEKIASIELEKLSNRVKEENIKYFTILDDIYPEGFKNIYKPPFVIFYKGNIDLLNKPGYLLTGNSLKDKNSDKNIELIFDDMFKEHILITLLYKGVDELIYEKANKKIGIIFFCADNINNPYCAININSFDLEKNLMLSEYYENSHVTKNTLRARNRLAVSISRAIVLISFTSKTGLDNLLSNALDVGKEIFCMPDNENNKSGNSFLINQGAQKIYSYKNIEEQLIN